MAKKGAKIIKTSDIKVRKDFGKVKPVIRVFNDRKKEDSKNSCRNYKGGDANNTQ